MRARHWRRLAYGGAAWAVLTVLWITGPHDCTAPQPVRITCQ